MDSGIRRVERWAHFLEGEDPIMCACDCFDSPASPPTGHQIECCFHPEKLKKIVISEMEEYLKRGFFE